MIKGVVIDAGGVLVAAGPYTARREWERRHGLRTGLLDNAWDDAVGQGWAAGRTEQEIHAALLQSTGAGPVELDNLLEVLGAHEHLDKDVAAFVAALRPCYRTAVLANAGPDRRRTLCERFGVDQLVDLIVISAEEGVAKPDPRAYWLAAERLGLQPAECLLIDDKQANVEGAIRAGMPAVQFRSAAQLADDFDRVTASSGSFETGIRAGNVPDRQQESGPPTAEERVAP